MSSDSDADRGETVSLLFARWMARYAESGRDDFEEWVLQSPHLADDLRVLYREFLVAGRFRGGPDEGSTALADSEAKGIAGVDPRDTLERIERRASAPRYQVGSLLGRGGMAEVFRVQDLELRRQVAMKVARLAGGVRGEHLERFVEEAQLTAQLDHPGVVPVYELGVDSAGQVFFTMKMVRGITLEEVIRRVHAGDPEWSRARALGVVQRVCEALSYAHTKGVLHRDLKPANVMVGRFGEVYLMDWGLARMAGGADTRRERVTLRSDPSSFLRTDRKEATSRTPDSPLLTMDGTVVGTPAYMAPEQARGEIDAMDARSDIYAVGSMLYHLLVGHAPYHPPGARVSARTVLARVLDGPPAPLRGAARGIPEELAEIVDRAMEREAALRFSSVAELGETLRAFQEGRIEERRGSIFEVIRLSTSLVTLYVGVLIVLLAVAVLLTVSWEATTPLARFALVGTSVLALGLPGLVLWKRRHLRLALPLLLGASFLTMPWVFLVLRPVEGVGFIQGAEGLERTDLAQFDPWGRPLHKDPASKVDTGPLSEALDLRVLVSVALGLAVLVGAWRRTRAPASLAAVMIALGLLWYQVGILRGLRAWLLEDRGLWFLPLGLGILLAGAMCDWRKRDSEARVLCSMGFVFAAAAWFLLAQGGYPAAWFETLSEEQWIPLSTAFGGGLSLLIGVVAQRFGSLTLKRFAALPLLVSPAAALTSLSALVELELVRYELALLAACGLFVVLSVALQRRNLLYAGAGYLCYAIFQISQNHFAEEARWPMILAWIGFGIAGLSLSASLLATRRIREAGVRRAAIVDSVD